MPPSRRDFLVTVLGAASLPLLGGCDGNDDATAAPAPVPAPPSPPSPPAPPSPPSPPSPPAPPAPTPVPSGPPPASSATLFKHGVASGDPLADRVILWTRITTASAQSVPVKWRIYSDAALTTLVREGSTTTDAAKDYTVKVDADGLLPGRSYYYRFEALPTEGAGFSPLGRTRTAPTGANTHLRIALVTCSNYASGFFNAYRKIAQRGDLDLVLHLGDYLYETGNASGNRADPSPAEMTTLPAYRSRHATTKTDADLQELHRQHPMVCIWDDHEFTNDAWQNGAQNHTEGTEGTWAERKAFAKQAYFEWLPVREQMAAPGRLYRDFAYGDLMHLVMLDGRVEGRSVQVASSTAAARTDATRSMLGQAQEDWLYGKLRGAATTWKLIGNQTMLGHLNETNGRPGPLAASVNNWMDQWDGYPPARQRLYDVLKGGGTQPKINNVVIATGDWHNSFIMDLPENPASGYTGATGEGSLAVEYVTPSVTSGFFTVSDLAPYSPHIKHHNAAKHGYQLLDVKPGRVIGEEWQVDVINAVSENETLAIAFETTAGSNRLKPYTMGATPAKANTPGPAPKI